MLPQADPLLSDGARGPANRVGKPRTNVPAPPDCNVAAGRAGSAARRGAGRDHDPMFSIFRSQAAMVSLKATWEGAGDALREAIERAARRLDELLQHEPQEQGESREDGTRILFEAPLGVVFEVDEDKKLVRVLRSWAYRRLGDACD